MKAPLERLVTRLTQFEHVSKPVAPFNEFLRRWLFSLGVVVAILSVSLVVGAAGYALLEKDPIAGFYDAAMIMSGMGPVNHPAGPWGKSLASIYALYSGLVLAVVMGILLAPLLHRVLHHMHLEDKGGSPRKKKSRSS
jgi:hypothetical protein